MNDVSLDRVSDLEDKVAIDQVAYYITSKAMNPGSLVIPGTSDVFICGVKLSNAQIPSAKKIK